MADNDIKVELTLAEFVGKLISETFQAVISSMVDQARQQEDIITGTELELAEFSQQFVSDDDVEEQLSALFPWQDDSHPHAIFKDAPYEPVLRNNLQEKPAIKELTGYSMQKTDFEGKPGEYKLTEKGVENIKSSVRMNLAQERQKALVNLMRQGLPKIIVDSGRILSKVTFRVTQKDSAGNTNNNSDENDKAGNEEITRTGKSKIINSKMITSKLKRLSPVIFRPKILDRTRMLVKQADDEAPQTSEASVYGEVEIKFKTIT